MLSVVGSGEAEGFEHMSGAPWVGQNGGTTWGAAGTRILGGGAGQKGDVASPWGRLNCLARGPREIPLGGAP